MSALTIGLLLTVSMAAFEALAIATILPETVREIGGLEWSLHSSQIQLWMRLTALITK